MDVPKHEQIKRELAEKFASNSSYIGSHVRQLIMETNFKDLKGIQRPDKIMKGDVFISFQGVKARPCVVVKVLKDRTVLYLTLTSTENVHCLTPFKSRFFNEGCFGKSLSVCTEEFAIENFAGVFDNMKTLNKAIKEFKEFISLNL